MILKHQFIVQRRVIRDTGTYWKDVDLTELDLTVDDTVTGFLVRTGSTGDTYRVYSLDPHHPRDFVFTVQLEAPSPKLLARNRRGPEVE